MIKDEKGSLRGFQGLEHLTKAEIVGLPSLEKGGSG